MTSMTGAEAVWQTLEQERVDSVFGILGVNLLPLYDALGNHPRITHYTTRHEQGAAAMADGYARTTGRLGVCLASTGPGALNTLSVLGESYSSSVPVLALASQVPSTLADRGKGALHESRDQMGAFRAVLGNGRRVHRVSDIPSAIQESTRTMFTGRPRPAYLEFCTDVLAANGEVVVTPALLPSQPAGNVAQVRVAARALLGARRPIIWVGGGAADAGPETQRLAELLGAPILTTTGAKGIVPEDHPLCLGNRFREGPVLRILREGDVLLAIGTRFAWFATGQWTAPLPSTLIQVDVDPAEIGKNYPAQIGIVGSASLVLKQLLAEIEAHLGTDATGSTADTSGIVAEIKEQVAGNLLAEGAEAELRAMADIRKALARDAIVVCDSAMPTYWARVHLPMYTPRSFVWPTGFGSLGISLPTALGAKVAWPQRQVLCLCGDGGFLFTGQELATAARYGINVVVLVFNDGGFGILRHLQDASWGGRHTQVDLTNPDFVKFAEAFGVAAWRVGLDEVGTALETAFAANRPALIEVPTALKAPWHA
ncbi:MAG: thiamine pyrophosphate-binding protein [Chloroflexota bacterium]